MDILVVMVGLIFSRQMKKTVGIFPVAIIRVFVSLWRESSTSEMKGN
jgi:hypothetical protein